MGRNRQTGYCRQLALACALVALMAAPAAASWTYTVPDFSDHNTQSFDAITFTLAGSYLLDAPSAFTGVTGWTSLLDSGTQATASGPATTDLGVTFDFGTDTNVPFDAYIDFFLDGNQVASQHHHYDGLDVAGGPIWNGPDDNHGGNPTPEPATLLLLSGGLAGLAGLKRKKG